MRCGQFLSCVKLMRMAEALLITGFAVMGYASAAPDGFSLSDGKFLLFFCIAYTVLFSIYLFNSWTGYKKDLVNSRLGPVNDCPRSFFLIASLLTGLASFILAGVVSGTLAAGVATVFLLWWMYSAWWKYRPFLGTILHVCVQMVQFHLGYFFLHRAVSAESLLTAFYLGMIFAAGHLHHELIDHDADRAAGVSSGAVFLGRGRALVLCISVFTASFLLLLTCAVSGYIAVVFAGPFAAAHLVQSAAWIVLLKIGGTKTQRLLLRHRMIYRILYLFAGTVYLSLAAGMFGF